ncbi:MAG: hypothetical protein LBV61_11225 [Burkholderiaceae bacterium]|jgi:Zn-dependent protease with chaperone function|nr:hypothetical protein [Burkholderiaceae bacterium]
MSAFILLNHLANFVAPAFFVAILLTLFARLLLARATLSLWTQIAINFVVGVLVLASGLALLGRDGSLVTYVALVGVCGTLQWFFSRGWKR